MDMTTRRLFLAALGAMTAAGCMPLALGAAQPGPGVVSVADFMPTDGKADVADKIQRVIDEHPNRTIWFPDGTYLISKPICTPADPKRSVDLRDPRINMGLVRKDDTVYKEYLQGVVHVP